MSSGFGAFCESVPKPQDIMEVCGKVQLTRTKVSGTLCCSQNVAGRCGATFKNKQKTASERKGYRIHHALNKPHWKLSFIFSLYWSVYITSTLADTVRWQFCSLNKSLFICSWSQLSWGTYSIVIACGTMVMDSRSYTKARLFKTDMILYPTSGSPLSQFSLLYRWQYVCSGL